MKSIRYIMLCLLLISVLPLLAGNSTTLFYHDTPQGVVRGDNVRIEVMLNGPDSRNYDMYLFYRQAGSSNYQRLEMQNEGFLYYAALNTESVTTGRIEYYIGYEGELGRIGTLPEASAQINPFVMLVAPAQVVSKNDVEITVLSPDPEETVSADEVVVAAYLMGVGGDFDFSRSKLLIDGANVTSMIEFADGVITFTPRQIKGGPHNVELNLYDAQNNLIGKKEWSFRAGGQNEAQTQSNYRGSVFMEERYQNVSDISDNYLRGGGDFSGRLDKLDASARLLFSSEESAKRQPVNRYSLGLRYNLSDYNNLYLKGGDFTPIHNPLTFYNKRVRGVEAGLQLSFFQFDFIYGQTYRGINGAIRQDTSATTTFDGSLVVSTINEGGVFSENVMSLRPGFRFGQHATWNLNLINAKEDPKSIKYGSNPKESLVVGTDLSLNFDQRRILFDAALQASMMNSNAAGPEITWDTLTSVYTELKDNSTAENMFNLLESTGFLSMTPGLSPFPSLGLNLEAGLRYFNNDLQLRYTSVAKNFATPGNPYMLKDMAGIYINDYIRVMNNQLYINLFYNNFNQDKSDDLMKTANQELGTTISYFPLGNIPSFTVGYASISRSNDITTGDTAAFVNPQYYMEDNTTQRFMLSTTYNLAVGKVRNAVSLTMNTYGRDENVEYKKENASDFTLYGLGVVSKFQFPLTTRINYSQSASNFGSAAVSKYETDIQRIFLGAEYELLNVMGTDLLKPFVNVTIQNIDSKSAGSSFSSPRNNYTVGLAYRNQQWGVVSLRFDQIAYELPVGDGSSKDYSDTVFNLRYQYNF